MMGWTCSFGSKKYLQNLVGNYREWWLILTKPMMGLNKG